MSFIEKEEIFTLKDFLLSIQNFKKYLIQMKWWLVGAMVLFASIFLLNAYFKKITYPAKMTFVVNTNNSNSLNLGGVSSILGQFGLGRSARVGGTNIDRLVELSKSERIIQNALFQKVEMFKDLSLIHISEPTRPY